MASFGFHSEAANEYLASTRYYLDNASPLVAAAFVAEIEGAIQTLLASPTTWPVIEKPQIRRYLLKRFPYSLDYRWNRSETEFRFMLSCTSAAVRITGGHRLF